jgi:hypothetical protein
MHIANSYTFIKDLTRDRSRIEIIVNFLREKNLLSDQQMKLLKRPGQNNKFPISGCINCMKEHLIELSNLVIEDAASDFLFRVVRDEAHLLCLLEDRHTLSKILSSAWG